MDQGSEDTTKSVKNSDIESLKEVKKDVKKS